MRAHVRPEDLVRYARDEFSASRATAIARHCADCRTCYEAIVKFRVRARRRRGRRLGAMAAGFGLLVLAAPVVRGPVPDAALVTPSVVLDVRQPVSPDERLAVASLRRTARRVVGMASRVAIGSSDPAAALARAIEATDDLAAAEALEVFQWEYHPQLTPLYAFHAYAAGATVAAEAALEMALGRLSPEGLESSSSGQMVWWIVGRIAEDRDDMAAATLAWQRIAGLSEAGFAKLASARLATTATVGPPVTDGPQH